MIDWNSDTNEAFKLFTYAQNARLPPVLSYMDQIKANARKCTIEQLISSLSQGILPSEYVLLDAALSQFDIDADPLSCFTFKWFQIFFMFLFIRFDQFSYWTLVSVATFP